MDDQFYDDYLSYTQENPSIAKPGETQLKNSQSYFLLKNMDSGCNSLDIFQD